LNNNAGKFWLLTNKGKQIQSRINVNLLRVISEKKAKRWKDVNQKGKGRKGPKKANLQEVKA
jgi:hypothetical protein